MPHLEAVFMKTFFFVCVCVCVMDLSVSQAGLEFLPRLCLGFPSLRMAGMYMYYMSGLKV